VAKAAGVFVPAVARISAKMRDIGFWLLNGRPGILPLSPSGGNFMPNIVSGLPGALVSLLAQSKNAERKAGSEPATSPPAPAAGGNAVRFDFSDPATHTGAPTATPATGYAAPANPAPASIGASTPIRTIAQAEPRKAMDGTLTGPMADPDEEARARAWAIQSITRENTLGMIDRIVRMAAQPEAPKGTEAITGDPVADSRFDRASAEPRTPARA